MLRYLAIIAVIIALSLVGSGIAMGADLSAEEVMAKVLLDQNAAYDVKLANAKVLLASNAGCEKLVIILNGQNHIEAKKLICEVLSKASPEGLFVTNRGIPDIFLEPLFKCLYSGDAQLSGKAALALADCFSQKSLARLAGTAVSDQAKLEHRLAAISAIENISGREALLNLAELLKDELPEIKDRAAQAICQRLMIDKEDFDPDYFTAVELPNIRWMSDVEYLMFQTRNLSRKNKHLAFEEKTLQEQMLFWQQKYLRSETDRFNSLTPDNKLVMLKEKLNTSQEQAVRQWAARQLVTWSNTANAREGEVAREMIKLLGELITDDQEYIRVAVAEVLSVFGNKAGTEPLIQQLLKHLESEQSPKCLRAVLNTLGQLQYTPAFEQCIKVWESCKDDDVAAAAISAAGKISAKIPAEESARIRLLVDSITANFSNTADSPVLRIAVFQAIKKIIEDEKWQNLAAEPFGRLIADGLADKLADVRSLAVYSQIALLKEQAPARLIDAGLLDDPEAPVRFAVIEAVDKFGSAKYLDILKNRLKDEQSPDVKVRLQEAMVHILNSMQVDDVFNWIVNLQNGSEAIRILKLQAVAILSEKASTLKSQTGSIDPKYEIAILEFSIADYLRKQQYEQAAQAMVDLLNIKIDDAKRVEVCDMIFNLIFDNNIDPARRAKSLDILQVAVTANIRAYDSLLSGFQEKYLAAASETIENVLFRARVLKQLIFSSANANNGTEVYLPADFWVRQGTELSDIIIEKVIAGELSLDQETAAILKAIDIRLADMPSEPQPRLEFLKKLKQPSPATAPAAAAQ